MHLKDFIKLHGYNYKSFALETKLHPRSVEMWSRGERMPRWQDAEKIFNFTKGEVTGHDLYEKQIQFKKTILQRNEI